MSRRSCPHADPRRRPKRSLGVARGLLACGAILTGALGVGAAPAGADTRSERDQVRAEAARLAAELDVLRAEDAELEKALVALDRDLAAQQANVAGAERAVAAADAALAAARVAETALGERLTSLESTIRSVAIDAYVRRGRASSPSTAPSDDLGDLARRRTLTDLVTTSASDVADELQATQEDLARARAQADAAATLAADRRAQAKRRLADLATARARQADFEAKLDARIEKGLAEAAGLATKEAALSARLAQEQAALAARRRTTSSGSATGSGRTAGSVPLRTVGGITVHADIADDLGDLLSAARRAGIELGGGGYRDPADQMRLREAHCPDPASSPALSCRPPTARPGFSMHEEGLAIDFTYEGRIISSRSNPAFRWLAANASKYGFHNLPSEPWHWSTTGD